LFLIFLVLAAKTERRGEKSWTGLKKKGRERERGRGGGLKRRRGGRIGNGRERRELEGMMSCQACLSLTATKATPREHMNSFFLLIFAFSYFN
jgi:hypothetical protein